MADAPVDFQRYIDRCICHLADRSATPSLSPGTCLPGGSARLADGAPPDDSLELSVIPAGVHP
ncbi:hypothetical protein, partial [Corynebacterium glyciniphilum]|uniref:hypothetical protein n=1 Tax=Corynebacterium glyciniphilum TaxID=1404244 RepID=UPI002654F155